MKLANSYRVILIVVFLALAIGALAAHRFIAYAAERETAHRESAKFAKLSAALVEPVSDTERATTQAVTNGKIAFVRDGNRIYIMNADGSGLAPFFSTHLDAESEPAWSPDGSKLAFISGTNNGNQEIYVFNTNGSVLTRLTTDPAGSVLNDISPAWSPNGNKIAWKRPAINGGGYDVFVMDAADINADGNGDNRIQITNLAVENNTPGRPSWSPDGTKIAFTRSFAGGSLQIATMNADGSNQTPLVADPNSDDHAAWSPDGSKIAFRRGVIGGVQILVANVSGGFTQITNNVGSSQREPAWAPDGTKIAFNSDQIDGSNKEIYVMNADGSNQTRLTNYAGTDEWPTWQAAPAPSPSPSPSPSPTYSFNGAVEDADSSRLEGAHLILTGDTNNDGVTDITRSTTTAPGDHGLFNFNGLPAGTYILTISADHRLFSPDTRTVALPTNFPNGSVTVTVRASSTTGVTPAGDNIQVTIGGTTLTLHRVVVNGVTTLTGVDPSQLVAVWKSLGAKDPQKAFKISTNAQVTAPIEVCYQAGDPSVPIEVDLNYLMLFSAAAAVKNITARMDATTRTICGRIDTIPGTGSAGSAGTAKSGSNAAEAGDIDLGTIIIAEATNVIAFNASSVNVSEGAGTANINLNRTGDTSGAATINYATSDSAGSSDCNALNTAIASSRCDYETTAGTLNFAAGETSKTIAIPIIDDSFADGIESFTITLTEPRGAAVAFSSSATVVIADNDSSNGANSIDQANFFVRLHYIDFLNREPDSSGLGFWSNQITECGANAACVDVRRTNVSAAFFLSIEFQETGYLVYRFYKAGYGNISGLPVPVRLSEFLPDTQQIGRGVVVGAANWQAQLEANKESYALDFVTRQRFIDAYANSMTPPQFVDALFLKAGVTPAPTDRSAAISEFGTAATSADSAARARSLRRVAENSTLNTQEYNKAFVLMQYFGYLRRNPNDAPDLDFGGFNFWLGKLNEFNGNFVNAEMVKAFITSGEYRGRFGNN